MVCVCMQIREAIQACDDAAAAELMPTLAQLITAPPLRPRLPTRTVLGEAGGYVRALWAVDGGGTEMARASELLSAVLESLVEPEDLLLGHGTAFVEMLLPALCDVRFPQHAVVYSYLCSQRIVKATPGADNMCIDSGHIFI